MKMKQVTCIAAIAALLAMLSGCQTNSVRPEALAPVSLTPENSADNATLLAKNPALSAAYFFVPKLRFDNALNNSVTGTKSQLEIKLGTRLVATIPPMGMTKLELLPNQQYKLQISETGNPYWVKEVKFISAKTGEFVAFDAYTTLLNLSDYPVFEPLDLNATLQRLESHTPVTLSIPEKDLALGATSLDNYFDVCYQADQQAQCQQLIARLPEGFVPAKVTAAMNKFKAAEEQRLAEQKQKQALADLEASLPASVRRDKYMVQLSSLLKQKDYKGALEVFPKIEALPIATDPSLKFFYGESYLKTGQPHKALEKLYEYVSEQGASATHYARALELISQAESKL